MEQKLLTREECAAVSGGALGLGGSLLTFGVMMIPSLITALISGALAIKEAVDPSPQPVTTTGSSFGSTGALRPYIRLSPVASRSTVAYGLPF